MKYLYIFISFVLIFSFYLPISKQVIAQSGTEHQLSGYAWSSNIGWISFSDTNSNVQTDSTGNLNGYAWSERIGWLQFGGLSGFPTGDTAAIASNAKIENNKIVGWAKFVGGNTTSGWDGWVLLSGSNHSIPLNQTTNMFSGYAWGDDVVGWIDFSGVSFDTDPVVVTTPLSPPTFNNAVPYCTSAIINWSPVTNATSYDLFRDTTKFSLGNVSSYTDSGLIPNTPYTYSLIAKNSATSSATSSPLSVTTFTTCGACGSSNGISTSTAPTTGLCLTGTATPNPVTTNPTNYTWSCSGALPASCFATRTGGGGSGGDCGPLDGVTVASGTTKTFFSSRISATCPHLESYCDGGILVNNNDRNEYFASTTFKFKKCVTPDVSEF